MNNLREFWDDHKEVLLGLASILIIFSAYKLLMMAMLYIENIGPKQ